MMKSVIKMLLLCSCLLLGGYAHTSQALVSYPGDLVSQSVQADYTAVHINQAFIIQAPPARRGHVKDPIKGTVVEENDDDNDDSAKKVSANNNDGIASFYRQEPAHISYSLSGPLLFCDHIPYVATSKFIFLCVIRV